MIEPKEVKCPICNTIFDVFFMWETDELWGIHRGIRLSESKIYSTRTKLRRRNERAGNFRAKRIIKRRKTTMNRFVNDTKGLEIKNNIYNENQC